MSKNKKQIAQSNTPSLKQKVDNKQIKASNITRYSGFIAVVITFLCFTSTINNDFVNWDDDRNFYENPLVQNINKDNFWANSKEIFNSGVIGNYNPLTIWTFAVEKLWFGFENTSQWHIDNVLLHLICVLLVYYIALLLGLNWQGALFVSLLFGVHPMRVESVAWVTERKDVLFGVFYLGALYQYLKFKKDNKVFRIVLLTIFFVLSLFSKIQAVSLPLSLIAVDYYLDKEWNWKSLINKIPFFGMSLAFGLYGVHMLNKFGSLASAADTTNFNFFQRLFIGSYSFLIYLIKLIIPFRLSPLYPYPNIFPWYFYPSMLIAPITLFIIYKAYQNGNKAVVFGLGFFIVNIVFLLQILGAGQGFLADRFTYIAYLGLFFIGGYYLEKYISLFPQWTYRFYSIGAIVLAGFFFVSYQQNKVWKNSATLWSHVLKYYDNTTLPYGNRANYYRDNGMYKEAMADYNKTISMKDDQPQAYNSRARVFFTLAKGRDSLILALNDYNKAISYDSTEGEFWVNRGATFARLGDVNNAIQDFNKGLKLKPDHAVGYLNRSIMYQAMDRVDLALNDIDSYLKINPYNSDLWYEKGRALRVMERPQEAIVAYSEAIRLKGNNIGLFYYERSKTYYNLNLLNEAKSDLQQSINYGYSGIDPAYPQMLGM